MDMQTRIDHVTGGIYRISTWVAPYGLTNSLFPSDLFLQPGDQPPVVTENLSDAMCDVYRKVGIFAHERPVRRVVDRIAALDPAWIHAMHGGTLTRDALPAYVSALRHQEFAYDGRLLGRMVDGAADDVAAEAASPIAASDAQLG